MNTACIVIPSPEDCGLWDENLPPAWVICDPHEKLRAKYCWEQPSASADFDLYSAQRRRNSGWADRIEGADLWATHLMNSRLKAVEVDALSARRHEIARVLQRVPDADLATIDLTERTSRDGLLDLFATCRAPGVSLAKVTKLLCLKRPRLIPMLDSHGNTSNVVDVYIRYLRKKIDKDLIRR